MSKVVVSEAKTAIKKFRSRNINTNHAPGQGMNFGYTKPVQPKCFNVLQDYKRVQKDLKHRANQLGKAHVPLSPVQSQQESSASQTEGVK